MSNLKRTYGADGRHGVSPGQITLVEALLAQQALCCSDLIAIVAAGQPAVPREVDWHVAVPECTWRDRATSEIEIVGVDVDGHAAVRPVSYTHLRAHET